MSSETSSRLFPTAGRCSPEQKYSGVPTIENEEFNLPQSTKSCTFGFLLFSPFCFQEHILIVKTDCVSLWAAGTHENRLCYDKQSLIYRILHDIDQVLKQLE